jgi:hypothetical protein
MSPLTPEFEQLLRNKLKPYVFAPSIESISSSIIREINKLMPSPLSDIKLDIRDDKLVPGNAKSAFVFTMAQVGFSPSEIYKYTFNLSDTDVELDTPIGKLQWDSKQPDKVMSTIIDLDMVMLNFEVV